MLRDAMNKPDHWVVQVFKDIASNDPRFIRKK